MVEKYSTDLLLISGLEIVWERREGNTPTSWALLSAELRTLANRLEGRERTDLKLMVLDLLEETTPVQAAHPTGDQL